MRGESTAATEGPSEPARVRGRRPEGWEWARKPRTEGYAVGFAGSPP